MFATVSIEQVRLQSIVIYSEGGAATVLPTLRRPRRMPSLGDGGWAFHARRFSVNELTRSAMVMMLGLGSTSGEGKGEAREQSSNRRAKNGDHKCIALVPRT